jgi:pyruvate formate lyase activating enzyme
MDKVLEFLRRTEEKNVPLWIRHVVVPGITDKKESILKIRDIAKGFRNLEKIELLPFRKMCVPKYEALGIDFSLKDISECPESIIEHFNSIIV